VIRKDGVADAHNQANPWVGSGMELHAQQSGHRERAQRSYFSGTWTPSTMIMALGVFATTSMGAPMRSVAKVLV